jgi:hypothetical protein
MRKSLLMLATVIWAIQWMCMPAFAQKTDNYAAFVQGFKNPPKKAQPIVYHWWLGGNVDTVRLKEELISLKNAGISGFTIFEIGSRDTVLVKEGPAFLGDESLKVLKFAIDEAGKLGMEAGLNTASSWNAGGNWLTPEHAAKSIYYTKAEISGGSGQKIRLPFPEIPKDDPWGKPRLIQFSPNGKPVFYKEIAVLAVPANVGRLDTTKIINVTAYFDPKTEELDWKAPSGQWEILRYVCSNSGENLVLPSRHSAGPIVDHFDAAATDFHFMYIINRLKSVLGNDLRKTALKSLYMASYEAKGFTWTTTLPAEFKKINGYDIYKFLPALFNKDVFAPDVHAIFRADFQRTLSELMINNFYKKSREICNAHGLKNNCEAGGPGLPLHNVPVEPIKALGSLDIPRGEFWINHSRFNEKGVDISRVVKEVSSASHIYGRGIVEMEAFTTFQHWQEGPFEMKPSGDRAFCEGMNKVVVHGSTHNPSGTGYPGIVYHAGTHYNDKRVWWPKVRPFNDYMSRISYIFQEADFVADVVYYYGDTIPNYGGHKNSRFTPGAGYDFEMVNTEVLLELVVRDGKLVLPRTGARFSVLALTEEHEIHPEVLLKLNQLAGQGAVIIGPRPAKIAARRIRPGMPNMTGMIDKLWTNYNPRSPRVAGRIYDGVTPAQMLGSMNIIPDFNYPDKELFTLDYIHYVKGDLDFYFIRNTTSEWVSRNCSFRQRNKIPELWDPVTGEIVRAAIFAQEKDHISIPVTLAPYESVLVVFRTGSAGQNFTRVSNHSQHPPLLRFTNHGICFLQEGTFELTRQNQSRIMNNPVDVKTLEGAWEVYFPEGWGAPARAIFPKLESWTLSKHDGIKYFSGIARYEKSFVHVINSTSMENQRLYLDLGDLSHVGEVWLNDQPLGITWSKPYRFDITDVIKPGANKLVVEIANTWSNRLVGDAVTGEKYTSTNITSTVVENGFFIRGPWAEVPLIKSGLFGPVQIITLKPLQYSQNALSELY